jgi:hypothetical protein
MHISGEWHLCDDGVERPVIHGEVQASDGSWVLTPFLTDVGADCTVLCADTLAEPGLPAVTHRGRLGGLGGVVAPVVVETTIQFTQTQGGEVTFRGQFSAVTDPEALDMNVLGRDITDLFAVIVDRPGDRVCLLRERHRYAIIHD